MNLKHYKKRLEILKKYRDPNESIWKECVQYLAPSIGCFDDPVTEKTKKKSQNYKININTLPAYYFKVLATCMVNNLTPSKLDWFSLAVKDETRDEYIWLKKQSEAIYDIFRGTDLFSNLYNAFLEASIVGTAVIGMQYDSVRKIDFVPLTIGQYWIEEGNNGFVDTCYRRFCMSAKNIVKEFGIDNLPRSVKLALERNEEDELFNVIHAVEPNDNYLPQWENYLNKPFNSVYFVENTGDDEQPLQVAGLSYFPYMVARWDKNITSAYGTGIGESILGDVKSLQKYESDLAKASSKTINPAMLASTQLKNVTKMCLQVLLLMLMIQLDLSHYIKLIMEQMRQDKILILY